MSFFILGLLWVLWCFIHSLLISIKIVDLAKQKLQQQFKYYRIFYNSFSLLTLVPVYLYMKSIPGQSIIEWTGPWLWVSMALNFVALLLFYLGAKSYHIGQFLGISQIKHDSTHSVLSGSDEISAQGVLGMMRHPWYTAAIMLLWAQNMNTAKFITVILLTLYLIIGTFVEERKLVAQFGEQYSRYQQQVSMFLPFKWLIQKLKPAG